MGLGRGEYLLYRVDGTFLSMTAHYYGDAAPTNNIAKAKAAKDCLQAVDQIACKEADSLVVFGDSKLVI